MLFRQKHACSCIIAHRASEVLLCTLRQATETNGASVATELNHGLGIQTIQELQYYPDHIGNVSVLSTNQKWVTAHLRPISSKRRR